MKKYRIGSDLSYVVQLIEHLEVGRIHVVDNKTLDFPTMRMAICKIAKDNGLTFKTRRISHHEMTIERIA